MASCRSCTAPITWVTSASTGKAMPVDREPTPNGNLAVVDGRAHAYGPEDERLERPRYTSHFATCPQAPAWRKR